MDQLELTKVTHINSGSLVVRISNCFPAHVVLSARYVHVESIEIARCVFFFEIRMSLYDIHEVFTADSKLPGQPAAETVVLKKSLSAVFPPLEIVMLPSWKVSHWWKTRIPEKIPQKVNSN